jgi:hypothetical protein
MYPLTLCSLALPGRTNPTLAFVLLLGIVLYQLFRSTSSNPLIGLEVSDTSQRARSAMLAFLPRGNSRFTISTPILRITSTSRYSFGSKPVQLLFDGPQVFEPLLLLKKGEFYDSFSSKCFERIIHVLPDLARRSPLLFRRGCLQSRRELK